MKKILVLGSKGFIGKHLIQYLLENNKEDAIYGVDRKGLSVGGLESKIFSINLLDQDKAADFLFQDWNEVYQLAADSGNLEYLNSREYDYGSQTLINLNIIRPLLYKSLTKLLFTSSYHSQFNTDYGIEKRFNERLYLRSMLPVCVVRLPNVFGIWDSEPKDEKVLNAICRKIAEASDGDTLRFHDDNQIRAFTHVKKVVKTLTELSPSDDVIDLPGQNYASITELCWLVKNISGKDINILTDFTLPDNKIFADEFIQEITGIYNHYLVKRMEDGNSKNNM
jgi:nucleoside-diphosphate-sugar epimerase